MYEKGRLRRQRQGDSDDDAEDDVPLHRKQAFGAGLKRKKVEFVRATETSESTVQALRQNEVAKGALAGNLYASIVLSSPNSGNSTPVTPSLGVAMKTEGEQDADGLGTQTDQDKPPPKCDVCGLPITSSLREHEASLAHQVSLAHSHPPSALDRSRMGLRALAAQGWDPDARVGLGREGEGMRFPIKVAAKDDTLGIGAVMNMPKAAAEEQQPRKLSAKEKKAQELREKQKAARLQGEIFGSVDVEKYLRGDGSDA